MTLRERWTFVLGEQDIATLKKIAAARGISVDEAATELLQEAMHLRFARIGHGPAKMFSFLIHRKTRP